jgi:hypothetical protein
MGDMEKVKWESESGRFLFYSFETYLKTGVQLFHQSNISDLKKSWRIIKRITKTRARPRVAYISNSNTWIAFRAPRIHGEEYIMNTLSAMKCTLEDGTFL